MPACFMRTWLRPAAAMAAHYRRALGGPGQHVDISAQEVAFSRTVNAILVWQFDQRKLHRVGGAINYGKSTVRCIWRLSDGWCFHTLMTGRFGAPANQALSDWMDELGVAIPCTAWIGCATTARGLIRSDVRSGKRRSARSSPSAPAPAAAAGTRARDQRLRARKAR